ncbi:MAG: response regulator [bacterium]|nr:response regulator [bacterium]
MNPPKTLLRPAPKPDREVVLVVDDERGPQESLRMILQPNYEVLVARNGSEALQLLRSQPVDLVTLDLSMPGIHGEELMRLMRQEFPEVEVVIITGHGSLENATRAIRYGVADYLQKPFDVVQVSAAVFRCLSRRRGRTRLVGFLSSLGETIGYQDQIESILDQASQDPRIGQRIGALLDPTEGESRVADNLTRSLECLEVLADTVENQSGFLRGHARRTGFYAGMLADRLKLSSELVEHVRIAGFLHDVGKIGVPTELLTRPGALDPKERAALEKHPEIGAKLVAPLNVPTDIVAAIKHHHEWWDGRGYGDGLFGEQIPLSARIVAIADAFDAMSCDRPYRDALAPEVVRLEIERYAGVQFDPTLADEFLALHDTSEVPLQVLAESTNHREDAAA